MTGMLCELSSLFLITCLLRSLIVVSITGVLDRARIRFVVNRQIGGVFVCDQEGFVNYIASVPALVICGWLFLLCVPMLSYAAAQLPLMPRRPYVVRALPPITLSLFRLDVRSQRTARIFVFLLATPPLSLAAAAGLHLKQRAKRTKRVSHSFTEIFLSSCAAIRI